MDLPIATLAQPHLLLPNPHHLAPPHLRPFLPLDHSHVLQAILRLEDAQILRRRRRRRRLKRDDSSTEGEDLVRYAKGVENVV